MFWQTVLNKSRVTRTSVLKTGFLSGVTTTSVRHRRFEAWAYTADYPAPIASLPRVFDHTYVVCPSKNARWRCHGGDQGGRLIASSGNGSYAKARCLADGAGGGAEAGIVYAATGVCHQIANRILYDADITVVEARGAVASSAVFGTYGTNASGGAEWTARKLRCYAPFKLISYPEIDFSSKKSISIDDDEADEKAVTLPKEEYHEYIARIKALYAQNNIQSINLLGADLEITLRYLLKEKISPEEIKKIIGAQREILVERQKNEEFLLKNDIDAMNKFSKTIESVFENFEKVLGESRYGEAFKIDPKYSKYAINPDYYLLDYPELIKEERASLKV